MRKTIKRRLGFVLVIAMLIVMIYPGQQGKAADGFEISGDGVLTGYTGVENAITIPAEVKTIGANVFAGKTITSVSFAGSNVTSIESGAFRGCNGLTSISIPASVTLVGAGAFQDCIQLYEVTWQSSAGIPENTFKGCVSLMSLNLSANLPSIGSAAFYGCESLETITIPAGTREIAYDAFDGCVNMEAINVAVGNNTFSSYDNCLYGGYDGNPVSLLRCPQGRNSVTIKEGTTLIGPHAFFGCNISTVTIPASVVTIMGTAFENSTIATLNLGINVTQFETQGAAQIDIVNVPAGAKLSTKELNDIMGDSTHIVDVSGEINDDTEEEPPTEPDTPDTPTTPTEPDTPDTPSNPDNGDSGTGGNDTNSSGDSGTNGNGTNSSGDSGTNGNDTNLSGNSGTGGNDTNSSGNSGTQTGNSGSGSTQQTGTSQGSSSGGNSNISTSVTESTAPVSAEHVKDETPKTGPELNARYILCLGVMLMGVYMILSSRKNETVRLRKNV